MAYKKKKEIFKYEDPASGGYETNWKIKNTIIDYLKSLGYEKINNNVGICFSGYGSEKGIIKIYWNETIITEE